MVDRVTIPLPPGTNFASEDRGGDNYQAIVIEALKGTSTDANGRFRVSEPITLFESRLLDASKEPLFWDEALISGSGITSSTPTTDQPYIDVISTASTAGSFVRQTYQRFRGGHVSMSGVIDLAGVGSAGDQREMGKFDDDNGAFFRFENGMCHVVTRTSDSGTPVDSPVVQTSWNIDVMDGTNTQANPSGVLMDWTKVQDFVIDHEWPGVVRFGIDIGGQIFYVHEVTANNFSPIPWTSSPNLPIRQQMTTTGGPQALSMRGVSARVISDGLRARGTVRGAATPLTVTIPSTGDIYALIGIRLKPTALDCIADIVRGQVFVSSNNDQYQLFLIFRPTVAGIFNYVDDPDSCMEVAFGDNTSLVTGGVLAPSIFGESQTDSIISADDTLRLGSAIDGTPDEYVIAIKPFGSGQDVNASVLWRQVF